MEFPTRRFRREADLLPLVRLLTAVEAVDHDGEDTSEASQRAWLNGPNHDPEQDRFVVERPNSAGELIGYAAVYAPIRERAAAYVAVHPEWREHGLGSQLLGCTLGRSRELGKQHVSIYANDHNGPANQFLAHRDFEYVSASWLLHLPAQVPLPEPHFPSGYSVRPFGEVQSVTIMTQAQNRSYADLWGHGENTAGGISSERVARSLQQRNPNSIWIAFAPDGQVAGFVEAQIGQGRDGGDCINGPGVVPEHRRAGLHGPLMLTALHWARRDGARPTTLELYGEDPRTVSVYLEMGFVLDERYLAYRRNLHG